MLKLISSRSMAVLTFVSCGTLLSACSFTFSGGYRELHSSSRSVLILEGNLIKPSGTWSGSGQVCYHVDSLGGTDQDGCLDFNAPAGSFRIERDVTSDISSMGLAMSPKVWVLVNGRRVEGTVLSVGVKSQSININGNQTKTATVLVGAQFRMPADSSGTLGLSQDPADTTRQALASLSGRRPLGTSAQVYDSRGLKREQEAMSDGPLAAGTSAAAL